MAFYSRVKVFYPSAGTAPFTETITGITDGATGTAFAVRTIIKLGGFTPANILSYIGIPAFGDTSYHWDIGGQHEGSSGSEGGGICNPAGLKIASGADGYGYTFMDTEPGLFFGGHIAGFGWVHNIVAGSFQITWERRDRAGDAMLMLCIGGDDYDLEVVGSPTNGTYTFASPPQGFIRLPSQVFAPNGDGPALTGAGGTSFVFGWANRDQVYSLTAQNSTSQGGNSRIQYTDRFSEDGSHISTWGSNTYTVVGSSGGSATLFNFCGANVIVKSGLFNGPASDGPFTFDTEINPVFVAFQSTGVDVSFVPDFTQGSICIGFVDPGLHQGSYWTGETAIGNGVPLKGGRWLSDQFAFQTATPNAGSTVFANIMTVTEVSDQGPVTVAFTDTDGTLPQIMWFAVGIAPVPPVPPPNPVFRTREVVRRRLRRAPIVWNEQGGLQTRVKINLFAVDMQPGVGTSDTPDPLVMIRASKDGGFTWGNERRLSAGRVGEFFNRINAWQWGQGRDWVFEIACTDPVTWNLIGAYIDAEGGEN